METKNFIIRESKFSDYEYFTKWEKDEKIVEFLSYDEDRSYEDVVTEALYNKKDQTKLDFTIVNRETELPVGRICISRINKDFDSLDITKFYIGETKLWGKGLDKEILNELLEYCFTFLHMERVTFDYYIGNRRAAALCEEMGFKDEGTARNAAKKDGKYYDLHVMSILRSEFFGDKEIV